MLKKTFFPFVWMAAGLGLTAAAAQAGAFVLDLSAGQAAFFAEGLLGNRAVHRFTCAVCTMAGVRPKPECTASSDLAAAFCGSAVAILRRAVGVQCRRIVLCSGPVPLRLLLYVLVHSGKLSPACSGGTDPVGTSSPPVFSAVCGKAVPECTGRKRYSVYPKLALPLSFLPSK